jgi:hypothetical protein
MKRGMEGRVLDYIACYEVWIDFAIVMYPKLRDVGFVEVKLCCEGAAQDRGCVVHRDGPRSWEGDEPKISENDRILQIKTSTILIDRERE